MDTQKAKTWSTKAMEHAMVHRDRKVIFNLYPANSRSDCSVSAKRDYLIKSAVYFHLGWIIAKENKPEKE